MLLQLHESAGGKNRGERACGCGSSLFLAVKTLGRAGDLVARVNN
jgi:hypothetical protein